MTDLTDVLKRATDGLSPESPDRLVTDAVRRGSGLRRRRHAVAAATAAAGIAIVCVTVVLAVRPGHSVGAATSSSSSSTTAPAPPTFAVARDQVGATFARIIPGRISEEHDTPAGRVHDEGAYESSFLWNGFRVAVAIWPAPGGDPHTGCRAMTRGSLGDQTCVRVHGGWAVHDRSMDDQSYNRWVSVFLDNGFRVWVLIYNSDAEKGSATAGPPPLDVPDLERVATSDLWLH